MPILRQATIFFSRSQRLYLLSRQPRPARIVIYTSKHLARTTPYEYQWLKLRNSFRILLFLFCFHLFLFGWVCLVSTCFSKWMCFHIVFLFLFIFIGVYRFAFSIYLLYFILSLFIFRISYTEWSYFGLDDDGKENICVTHW